MGKDSSSNEYIVNSLDLKDSVKSSLAEKSDDVLRHMISAVSANVGFNELDYSGVNANSSDDQIKSSYDLLSSFMYTGGNSTGYKSIIIINTADNSAQNGIDESGSYSCDLLVDYNYTIISETASGKLDESSSSSRALVRFTYSYESGKWVLSAIYLNNLGLNIGSSTESENQSPDSGSKNNQPSAISPPMDSGQSKEAPYNSQRILVKDGVYGWTLELEEWVSGRWTTKFQSPARVGKNGTSENTREGDHKTPAGTFNVLFCYGISQPDTNLKFKRIRRDDVFVDDTKSPYYNTIVDNSLISSGTSHEKIYNHFSDGKYNICIFFDFNGDGETANSSTSGHGSVRILRGKTGTLQNTLGDIDISSRNMTTLLSYLDSAKHPIIIIE